MKKGSNTGICLDAHSGCFGNFNRKDLICKKLCALSLRCAIESDQNIRIELLEELVSTDSMFMKMQ